MNAAPNGLVLVDKPRDWTSHDVVAKSRGILGTRKVGHAGTLDPMATGLLVLGVGKGTKLLTYLVGSTKEYTATIRLGQATVTDDAEGEVTSSPGCAASADAVRAAVAALTGPIMQRPSSVSAIKIDGKRSYARVRGGEDIQLPERPVTVFRFDVDNVRQAVAEDGTAVTDLDAVVECSSGTYIRALARDLGAALGSAGHLTALRRTRVGGFGVGDASGLDGQLSLIDLPTALTSTFPIRNVSAGEAAKLRVGQWIDATPETDETAGDDAVRGAKPQPVDPEGRPVDPEGRPVWAAMEDGVPVALIVNQDPTKAKKAKPILGLA